MLRLLKRLTLEHVIALFGGIMFISASVVIILATFCLAKYLIMYLIGA